MTDLQLSPMRQFSHDSKWWWLRLRLAAEYPLETVRAQLRQARVPSTGIRIEPQLARLTGLKEVKR